MNISTCLKRKSILPIIIFAALLLPGCGSDGNDGAPGEPGPVRTSVAESLDITIDKVSINSAPVVEMTITDENGVPMAGLTTSNMRFTIAKLVPGSNGDPSSWQSYINRLADGELQATAEARDTSGELEDQGNGQYIYTFSTDITDPAQTEGVEYDPSLTHRVAIQVSGFPASNPTFDFRPDGGDITLEREIVKTETCNTCHNKLAIHGGGRIEMKYCVTCHNPGSTDPDTGNTVDFKVMVHKIHRGEDLPSVINGGKYEIIGFRGSVHDYSDVVFPQDIRNCTNCHDGSDPDTPQGDNWKTALSIEACGSCHDNIDFSKDGSENGANDPLGHSGGIMNDNSACSFCHAEGGIANSVSGSHAIPAKAEAMKYAFNIPDVTTGATPAIQISVTDPSNGDTAYDLSTDPFTGGGARLAIIIGWGMPDFHNTGTTTLNSGFPGGFKPTAAQPISIDPVAECAGGGSADWICAADTPTAGIYTLTKQSPLPAEASGTARVGFEGHVAADFDSDGSFDDEIPVTNVFKDFAISGTLTARREVVDIAKCNNCHESLSLHGGNRNNEPGVCVICHNPNATDTGRRPVDTADSADGKVEEAIDFKTMIHAIHAGAETGYDGSDGHGIREQGLVVWGFPGAPCTIFGGAPGSCEHDFSHVRYPGMLNDCESCHKSGTYELDGDWATPTSNGILSTTVTTGDTTTPDDDLNVTPTAAVCSSCHDGSPAELHAKFLGGALFDATQADITDTSFETCSVCHGPGTIASVKEVHGVE